MASRAVALDLWYGFCCAWIVFLILSIANSGQAIAHDSWISRGAHRNLAGEWCCGDGDCSVVPNEQVELHADGYHVHQHIVTTTYGIGAHRPTELDISEIVPFIETQPSPDGAFWRCQRADGSRRCFFAPPPGS